MCICKVPTVPDGKGITMKGTALTELRSIGAIDKLACKAGDTTSTVNGEQTGCFALLEKEIGRPLLKSYCRQFLAPEFSFLSLVSS